MLYPSFNKFTEFGAEKARIAWNPISSLYASQSKIWENSEMSESQYTGNIYNTPKARHLQIKEGHKDPNSTIQMLKLHGRWSATFVSQITS